MSASAPNPSKNSDEGGAARPAWIGLSILTHGALLAWLIFLWPPTEIKIPAEGDPLQSETSASPEQIQQVAEQIALTQADEIRAKVEELLETQRRLNNAEAQKQAELAALATEQAADAPAKTREALADIAKAQSEALQAETESAAAATEFAQTEDANSASAKEKLATLQQKAKDAQYAAAAAQTAALQNLNLQEGHSIEEAKTSQTAAQAAQQEANRLQDEAVVKTTQIEALRKTADRVEQLAATATRQTEKSKSDAVQTQEKIDKIQAEIDALKQALTEQKTAITEAQAKEQLAATDKEKRREAENVGRAKSTAEKTAKTITAQEKKLAEARKRLEELKAEIAANTEKANLAAAKAAQARTALLEAPSKVEQMQKEALAAQQKAKDLQASAQSAVASALASTPSMVQAPPPTTAVPPQAPSVGTPPPVSLENKTLAELYDIGVATEKHIAESYKNIQAADVAAIRQIPLAEAKKSVEVARPDRPDLAASLSTADTSTQSALEGKKEAIEKAIQEIDSMVGQSRGMLAQAATATQGDSASLSTEALRSAVENANTLAAIATDRQDGTKTADLSGIMKQIQSGDAPAAAGSKPGEAAAGPAGGGANGSSDSGWTSPFRGEIAPPMGPVKESVPGRKVHAPAPGITGGKWMYLDTWYVIGPFPNANRQNIDKKFPPETVVNLDGIYPGIDNKALRWQFLQTDQPRLRPPLERPYAIYYAYTTLWFDQPQDLWIGVGSDDFSKIWINDMLVWASGPQQKEWRPDEGFRKVHFKQGLNRVLYRIENGQAGCSFSLKLAANSATP